MATTKLTRKLPVSPRRLREGDAGYDPAKRAELDRRCTRIAALDQKSAIAQWHEGDEFLHIRDLKLFRQDGFSSMEKWVAVVLGRSPRTVSRRMAFAESIPLKELQRFQPDALNLALEYVALSRDEDAPWSPGTLLVRVPREDGSVEEVKFPLLTTEELQRAVDHQKDLRERRRKDALPDEQRALADDFARSVATETGALATVEARPPKSGLPEDTMFHFAMRAGDLRSVLARLQAVVEAQNRRSRGRG